MTDKNKNMPIGSERKGSISIAIFDGTYGKNAVVQKSYLKKGGNPDNEDDWKRSSINLFMNELENLKIVTDAICEQFADEIEANKKKE